LFLKEGNILVAVKHKRNGEKGDGWAWVVVPKARGNRADRKTRGRALGAECRVESGEWREDWGVAQGLEYKKGEERQERR